MSKYDKKVSPIKMLNSASKSTQTPARYLKQRNETMYEEDYHKQKCQRLQKQIRQLNEHVRIIQTQNKQLKTQIQFYRQQSQPREKSNQSLTNQSDQPKMEQVQKLLKEIRLLKNNHQIELNSSKSEQKRLNKQILQLEDQIHNNQLAWKKKCQQAQINVQQRNKQLQKELKEMRKSVVIYMEQRDQNQQVIENLKFHLQQKNIEVSQLLAVQKQLLDQRATVEEIINRKSKQQQISFENIILNNPRQQNDEIYNLKKQMSLKQSQIRNQLYQFGVSDSKKDKIRQSHFSIHTFNGARHVPAQEAFQISQSLKNQIHRLQNEIQKQSIFHVKDINDLTHKVERCQKEIKEKENDLVNLLTKVKPLLLDKLKMTTKQNVSPKKNQSISYEDEKQSFGKNAFGLRMLQMFLKKYKIQAF